MAVLTCQRCQAPLPAPVGSFVTCTYCGATTNLASGAPVMVSPGATPALGPAGPSYEDRTKAASATFERRMASGATPEQAAWYAAQDWAEPGIDPGEVGYGAIGLAKEFDAANGTTTLREPTAMVRLFSAYAKAVNELREKNGGTTTINLPFLSAGGSGPVHLDRTIDAAGIASLLARARAGAG